MKEEQDDVGWLFWAVVMLCIIGWTIAIVLVATART